MNLDAEMDTFETYKHPAWVRISIVLAMLFTAVLVVWLAVLFLASP